MHERSWVTMVSFVVLMALVVAACGNDGSSTGAVSTARLSSSPAVTPALRPTMTAPASATDRSIATTTGEAQPASPTPVATSPTAIPQGVQRCVYRVVNEFPHDPTAFTQGLIYEDGRLLEGTGLYGESTLREVDLETGEVLRSLALSPDLFGEGIALLDGRIYQITWQEQVAIVYDAETFEEIERFSYTTEGWGITDDGERLYMSDGSSRISIRDPETFNEIERIQVRHEGEPVTDLNELEWIDGQIYANVWQTDSIVRIDPATGEVTAWIDLSGLLTPEDREGFDVDVLNGIAWDEEGRRLFVTGKLWPRLYEIELECS